MIVFLLLSILVPLVKPQVSYLKTFEKDGTTLRIPEINLADSTVSYQDTKELYQFNITLTKPAEQNVFAFPLETSGLEFVYQPPLNEELDLKLYDFVNATHALIKDEIVVYRPENVVGSWVVLKTVKGFGTGKLYHIYRPLIIDAKGSSVWANLTVTKSQMQITINTEWLKTAVYPVVIDPSFGKTDVGASTYTYLGFGDRDEKVGCNFTLSENGDVTALTAYLKEYDGVGQTNGTVFGIYDSSNNLEGQTEYGDIPAAASWVTLDFASPISLTAGDYWLTVLVDVRTEIHYDAGDAGQTKGDYPDDFTDGLSDPFGGAEWTDSFEVSIYANYTTGGATEISEYGSGTLAFSSNHYNTWQFGREGGQTVAFSGGQQKAVLFSVFSEGVLAFVGNGFASFVEAGILLFYGSGVLAFTGYGSFSYEQLIIDLFYYGSGVLAFLGDYTALGLGLGEITTNDLIGLIIVFFVLAISISIALIFAIKKKK